MKSPKDALFDRLVSSLVASAIVTSQVGLVTSLAPIRAQAAGSTVVEQQSYQDRIRAQREKVTKNSVLSQTEEVAAIVGGLVGVMGVIATHAGRAQSESHAKKMDEIAKQFGSNDPVQLQAAIEKYQTRVLELSARRDELNRQLSEANAKIPSASAHAEYLRKLSTEAEFFEGNVDATSGRLTHIQMGVIQEKTRIVEQMVSHRDSLNLALGTLMKQGELLEADLTKMIDVKLTDSLEVKAKLERAQADIARRRRIVANNMLDANNRVEKMTQEIQNIRDIRPGSPEFAQLVSQQLGPQVDPDKNGGARYSNEAKAIRVKQALDGEIQRLQTDIAQYDDWIKASGQQVTKLSQVVPEVKKTSNAFVRFVGTRFGGLLSYGTSGALILSSAATLFTAGVLKQHPTETIRRVIDETPDAAYRASGAVTSVANSTGEFFTSTWKRGAAAVQSMWSSAIGSLERVQNIEFRRGGSSQAQSAVTPAGSSSAVTSAQPAKPSASAAAAASAPAAKASAPHATASQPAAAASSPAQAASQPQSTQGYVPQSYIPVDPSMGTDQPRGEEPNY